MPRLRLRAHISPDLCGTLPNRAHTRPGLLCPKTSLLRPRATVQLLRPTADPEACARKRILSLRIKDHLSYSRCVHARSLRKRSGTAIFEGGHHAECVAGDYRSGAYPVCWLPHFRSPRSKGLGGVSSRVLCCAAFSPRVEHVAYARSSVMRYRD